MEAELQNVMLFVAAIAKSAVMTGLGIIVGLMMLSYLVKGGR
jgi:hypothetical protein